jgi:hypothetical protein
MALALQSVKGERSGMDEEGMMGQPGLQMDPTAMYGMNPYTQMGMMYPQ